MREARAAGTLSDDGNVSESAYLPEEPGDAPNDSDELIVFRGIRDALNRQRPAFLTPETVDARWEERYLRLMLRHTAEPEVRLALTFGDGYLEIEWPFEPVTGHEHADKVLAIVVGTLSGSTVEKRRLKGPLLAYTEITAANRGTSVRRREFHLPGAAFLVLPGVAERRIQRSLSFDRSPAIVAA